MTAAGPDRNPDPDEYLIVRELTRRQGLRYFLRRLWSTIESVPYHETWHFGAICEVLTAVFDGQISGIVINVPPGTGKSTAVSVMAPAWQWTRRPEERFICSAYGDAIVLRDARRQLAVCRSPLYRAAWPEVEIVGQVPAAANYETTRHGRRYSAQIGGQVTGFHGGTLIIDDPIKPSDAAAVSGTALQATNDLIRSTLTSRFAPGERPKGICIMQRLAAGDPAEMLLDWGWEHLCLPMHYVPNASWDRGCSLGKLDQRTQPGELLCTELQDAEAVQFRETGLGTPANIAAQMQQNPVPEAGAFFEAAWFRTWTELPKKVRYCQSWDLGFKGRSGDRKAREAHSRVHGALWAFTSTDYYLVDEIIGLYNYPETKKLFAACCRANARNPARLADAAGDAKGRAWPRCEAVLVEDKANGTALLQELGDLVAGVRAIEPDGSKEDRAARHSATAQNGQIYLPDEPWAQEFLAELVRFPRQRHNDRVDTTSQALDYMTDKTRRLVDAYTGLDARR